MKTIKLISRIFVGALFIFSGTVKAIDPMGTIYKLQDYFQAFGIGFMKPAALLLTILLCTTEFIAGFTVLLNLKNTRGIWLVIIMMTVFTPLTFILALTNPVSDCGCFGDAIKLTNWQTFFKNIIIMIPAVFLFVTREKPEYERFKKEIMLTSTAALVFIFFLFYNKVYLPVIDFLPYRIGTNIPSAMIIPEGSAPDKYETTFIYEKGGKMKEFTLENYPSGDSTWKFIEQRSILVSKGYQPPVHDFRITAVADGSDITETILGEKGFTLLMIAKKLEESDDKRLNKGYELGRALSPEGTGFYVLTSTGTDALKSINSDLIFCQADETTLKTMVRSNPGYILLKDGSIIGKWSWAGLPKIERFKELINKQ